MTAREPQQPGPRTQQRAVAIVTWCAAVLLLAAVVAAALTVAALFAAVTAPVALSVLGAALLRPLAARLVRRGVSRGLAAGLTCVALVVLVGVVGWALVTALADSAGQIADALRLAATKLRHRFGPIGTMASDAASGMDTSGHRFASDVASGVISGVSLAAQLLAGGILTLALTFFLMRDADRIPGLLRRWSPPRQGNALGGMAREAFGAVSGFMRGTSIVAAVDAVLITIGLLALGVPGALGLGAVVFIGAYIPYVGAAIASFLAVLVAFAEGGLAVALWTIFVVAFVQIAEGNLLRPWVQSKTVSLHPGVVMVAVTAGASVGGVLGTLLAVPVAAVLAALARQFRRPAPADGEADAGAQSDAG